MFKLPKVNNYNKAQQFTAATLPATKLDKNFLNWHLEGRLTKMTFLTKDKKLEGFLFILYFYGIEVNK